MRIRAHNIIYFKGLIMADASEVNGRELYQEFSNRMEGLEKEGLVDFKMKVFNGRDTSVDGVVLTLNNALRLREEGKFEEIDIH